MQTIINDKLKQFLAIVDNDMGLATELAGIFCETIPPLLIEIRLDFEQKNLLPFTQKMHKLKGTVGYTGFTNEFTYISNLEKNAKLNSVFPSSPELRIMENKVRGIIELFHKHIQSKPTAKRRVAVSCI
ncbi:hypothetical protein [Thalassotalea atypica]|uniref:hypothetical protein n=1 Tax=Thalassotalea atypica TaxID=2054316 RepID=UPI0025725306|nr:hypothetical protein [Thalassotalea atypica]